jgi:hypothetical protein
LAEAPPQDRRLHAPEVIARSLSRGEIARALTDFIRSIVEQSDAFIEALIRKKNWSLPDEEIARLEQLIAPYGPVTETTEVEQERENSDAVAVSSGDAQEPNHDDAAEEGQVCDSESQLQEREPATGTAQEGAVDADTTQHPTPIPSGQQAKGVSDTPRSFSEGGPVGLSGGREQPNRDGSAAEHSGTNRTNGSQERPRTERRVSYAIPDADLERDTETAGLSAEEREAIQRAGEAFVIRYEKECGNRTAVLLGQTHPGWDLDSYEGDAPDPRTPEIERKLPVRHIEVKAKRGAWDGWGVGLTRTEHQMAQRHGDRYWLYVVEHACEPQHRRLYVFRNPASSIQEYRLDANWRDFAGETWSDSVTGAKLEDAIFDS